MRSYELRRLCIQLLAENCRAAFRRRHAVALSGLQAVPCAPVDLRVKSNFSNRIKLFLSVQSRRKKFSASQFPQITSLSPTVPSHRGALAIVTDAGRDAVDASGASDESAQLADGEVVWS